MEYQTRASIIPEYELQDKVSEVIESYGLLFGLTGNIREPQTPSYLLELYPYMINSISFQQDLMREPFSYGKSDPTITLYQYFTEIHHPTFLNTIHKYTLGLPATIAGALQSDSKEQAQAPADTAAADSAGAEAGLFEIVELSPAEERVMNQMRSRISASFQRRTGIVEVQAKMPNPELAAKVVQMTLKILREKVRGYKTGKARAYKKFLLGQQAKAKAELEETREALIGFRGAGSQPLNKRMELQSRYGHTLDRYNTLTQQVERIELSIQEQFPVFRILDDITVPDQKSEPNRKLIVTFSLILGFLVAVCWITVTFFFSTLTARPS